MNSRGSTSDPRSTTNRQASSGCAGSKIVDTNVAAPLEVFVGRDFTGPFSPQDIARQVAAEHKPDAPLGARIRAILDRDRRYVESLSSYARQFLRQMQKPDVDEIVGLSPAISIDQKSRSNNPRSTVATITEIYDYLHILYARIGHPHCLVCGEEIKKLSNEEIKNFVLEKIAVQKISFKKSIFFT